MPKYVVSNTGELTTANDPNREIWYSSGCKFWTDDWDKVIIDNIPCCPICKCPGFQIEYQTWMLEAMEFENDHPRYIEFLTSIKETCNKNSPRFLHDYEEWIRSNET